MARKLKVVLPEFPEHCGDCNRKLDSRMLDNPFGMWSIPTMEGATGKVRCSYCHDLHSGKDPLSFLPVGCKALEQLALWLAQEGR